MIIKIYTHIICCVYEKLIHAHQGTVSKISVGSVIMTPQTLNFLVSFTVGLFFIVNNFVF